MGPQKRTDISYNAAISAFEKGEQWEQGLGLLKEMRRSWLKPNVISDITAIRACAMQGAPTWLLDQMVRLLREDELGQLHARREGQREVREVVAEVKHVAGDRPRNWEARAGMCFGGCRGARRTGGLCRCWIISCGSRITR